MIATETYTPVIVIGAGFSGLIVACQLQRKLHLDDYAVYDRAPDFGGTWQANQCAYEPVRLLP